MNYYSYQFQSKLRLQVLYQQENPLRICLVESFWVMKILDKKNLFVYTYFIRFIQYLLLDTKGNLFHIEGNLSTALFSDII